MKKLSILLLPLFLVACTNQPTAFDDYCKKYYSSHPNGYTLEETWYNFTHISSSLYENGCESIQTIDFTGTITFNSNSFRGKTNKFVLKTETINYFPNGISNKITTYDSLIDKNWYSEKYVYDINTKKSTKGRNDLESVNISFAFNDDFFDPKKLISSENKINFNGNHSRLYLSTEFKNDEYETNKLLEFFLNEESFNLSFIRRSECFTTKNNVLYTSESTFKETKKVEIEINTNYEVFTKENGPSILNEKL